MANKLSVLTLWEVCVTRTYNSLQFSPNSFCAQTMHASHLCSIQTERLIVARQKGWNTNDKIEVKNQQICDSNDI